MNTRIAGLYRCPIDRSALEFVRDQADGGSGDAGALVSPAGRRYRVVDGVPQFVEAGALSALEEQTQAEYDRVAEKIYDTAVDWQFAAFHEDEDKVREGMADLLEMRAGDRVLEIGCGTGRDSFRLARRLGADGTLFLQDLSSRMVFACRRRMSAPADSGPLTCALDYFVSSASHLPFADGYFDAVFHFGGLNQFGDIPQALAEMTRVTRLGGRVVVGDEAVAPWLKNTEFNQIVTTNNALFAFDAPLEALPVSARDVTLRWVVANCFYVIAFTKGDGPPPLDLDLPHQGWRGGTMRSRYFGRLEGVTPEAKALVQQAAAAAGVSVHDWLTGVVTEAAAKVMTREPKS